VAIALINLPQTGDYMTIKISFLLPNRTIAKSWIVHLLTQPAEDVYNKLLKISDDNSEGLTCKIGNGSFSDTVQWYRIMRTAKIPNPIVSKRKGYQLVTFTVGG
jgi:hypothetical protein